MFERRHYEAIAGVMRVATKTDASRDEIVNWLADMFAEDNGRFNRARFLDATRPKLWPTQCAGGPTDAMATPAVNDNVAKVGDVAASQ